MRKYSRLLMVAAAALALLVGIHAQDILHPSDTSALRPPAGAKVAIVEFADLECPMCRAQNPVIMQAVKQYRCAWVRYDFPLPEHPWSFQAAVYAKYFEAKSKDLGYDYENQVFANQPAIETKADLTQFTQRFAQQHGTSLPFALDPQGKFTAEVKADMALGDRMGVHETPTVWVVTNRGYQQVTDFDKLFSMLDQAEAQAR
jgi:protein-disulfide isomerase